MSGCFCLGGLLRNRRAPACSQAAKDPGIQPTSQTPYQRDSKEDVLAFVLHNSKLPQDSVCQLLCTSQTTADIVRDALAGTIPFGLHPSLVPSARLLNWLSKNAVLFSSFTHNPSLASRVGSASASTALSKAAALPSGLALRQLNTSSVAVLAAVSSCRALTCLQLELHKDALFPSTQHVVACIAGLRSRLCALKLQADRQLFNSPGDSAQPDTSTMVDLPGCGLHSLLQQVLPQLTVLTRLEADVPDASVLVYAPQQLKALCVMGVDDSTTGDVKLGHLRACTLLQLMPTTPHNQKDWRAIRASDTLPPNLQALSIPDCTSAAPLLFLEQLTKLSLAPHCHIPLQELQQLSVLTQLRATTLGYSVQQGGGNRAAEQGSAGWGSVPGLCCLELHGMWIDPRCDLLQHLAGLTALTRLFVGKDVL